MDKVTKFNLEAAFKALDELDIPTVKGIRANRVNLSEHFTHKAATTSLIEDYYDVGSTEDLTDAQEAREAEVAKAKLARIEKIVDLNAETEEDLLPSYVGKNIIQCPQCMTLFYKNPEDIEASEENPEIVNINEVCQHCGNTSGYELIGKVDKVGADETANFDVEDFEGDELNLDFDEPTEEVEEETVEETVEEAPAEEEDLELDLDLDFEEEPVEESIHKSEFLKKAEKDELKSDNDSEYLTLNEDTISISKAEMAKLDKEVEDATKEVAKYNIPMRSQKTSAGTIDNVPDFEVVPEAQREAAKKAYDRYKKALAARPDRAKNIINYTDESVHKSEFLKKAEEDELKSDNDSEYLTLNEESVVYKKVDDLYSVMNGDRQVFAGTEEECKDWLEARKSPATIRFKIVKGAEVPVASKDESLTEDIELTEDSGFDELMDMVENEPISEEEVEAMLDGPLFTDKEEEVDFEVVEDFDEESFNEHLSR